ncbi:hypothetical protein Bpfe_031118 [Biomphalaria pfeifferi]|uniref:Uncharacterized protein n=1 Tax=Biomphalaria pfeifferi TaxID=112525 RepID=A0AAD8EU98_BIOPF|nr:hypothetical protein Bpfe_031118 [Biomphalaria pfeifferi]
MQPSPNLRKGCDMAKLDLGAAFARFAVKDTTPKPTESKVIEAHIEPTPGPAPVDSGPNAEPTMEKNPFIVPAAQTLTQSPVVLSAAASAAASTSSAGTVKPDGTIEIHSAGELAAFDPEKMGLEVQNEPQKQELVRAAVLTKRMILDDGKDVRNLLDAIDSTIESFQDKLAGPGLITLRNYVQSLMVTLKQHPEFDSILIDKDVHNVMRFIRAVRGEALAARDIKEVKREVKKAKAAATPAKGLSSNSLASAFSALMMNQLGSK